MVTAVKHGLPRTVMNNSPFYITSNAVPDFSDDDENVKRRIAIFRTKSLPHYTSGADRWMFDHAMDCISRLHPAFFETLRYSGEDVALVPGESLLCHSPEEPLPPLEADSQ